MLDLRPQSYSVTMIRGASEMRCLTCFRDNIASRDGLMCIVCERLHSSVVTKQDVITLAKIVETEAKQIIRGTPRRPGHLR
jgi:hypothetical protein